MLALARVHRFFAFCIHFGVGFISFANNRRFKTITLAVCIELVPVWYIFTLEWKLNKFMPSYVLFHFRNLQKEVESFQNKVERKTGQSVNARDENICEVCHKTKFTDGSGKECKYCKLKVCARCGVQVTIPGSKQVNFANSLNVLKNV